MAKLIYGVGYNSRKRHKATSNGRPTEAYDKWHQMIQRCYSEKNQVKNPTYIDCTIEESWHDFQNFADWFYSQKHSNLGYQLDKDLISVGNKIYSSENCRLVPSEINNILLDCRANRGQYPQGVYLDKPSGKYKAQLSANSKKLHLGYFDCPDEAHQVYKEVKERHVKNKALEWANRIEWDVFVALMNWTLDS